MSETSLEDRIHSIRRAIRSRQPLQQRIDLVRQRHRAARSARKEEIAQSRSVGVRFDA